MKRMTVPKFIAAKAKGKKLSMMTAYDFQWATIFDEAGIDGILVGDTLGMVVQGHASTLPVTLDQMIYHGEIVARAAKRALVVVDMPFMSYQVSPEQAITNAGRILKETTALAVKLEGGENQAKTIAALTNADIPVMAHVGLKPQSVNMLGSLGKIQRDEKQLLADARAAQNAGAFSIVLEMVPQSIAKKITADLTIPTIGIGAGADCDGQVLVSNDMFNLTPNFNPKFLKKYADFREIASNATRQYIDDVNQGNFPSKEHSHD